MTPSPQQRFTTTVSPQPRFSTTSPQQSLASPSPQDAGVATLPHNRFNTPTQSPQQRFTPPGSYESSRGPSPSQLRPKDPFPAPLGIQSSQPTPPSLSQQAGYHQAAARRRSFNESNPPPPTQNGMSTLAKRDGSIPPLKSMKTEDSKTGLVKSDVLTYDDIKREALGSPDKKPFSPTKMPYMETGCGSTLFRNVAAFSGPTKEERNPALTAKIDEDFSSCRAPLEVLKDVMTDPDWSD